LSKEDLLELGAGGGKHCTGKIGDANKAYVTLLMQPNNHKHQGYLRRIYSGAENGGSSADRGGVNPQVDLENPQDGKKTICLHSCYGVRGRARDDKLLAIEGGVWSTQDVFKRKRI